MKKNKQDDLSGLSLLELFRAEAENQTAVLMGGLLELERSPAQPQQLETLMRAAHSLKGAARIVNLKAAVRVAHAMEDCFVAAQNGRLKLKQAGIDALLRGVDLLAQISKCGENRIADWGTDNAAEIAEIINQLEALPPDGAPLPVVEDPVVTDEISPLPTANVSAAPESRLLPVPVSKQAVSDRPLRLTAENLNRLLGLAGESLVESRWLRPFSDSMQRLKRLHTELAQLLDGLRGTLESRVPADPANESLAEASRRITECKQFLTERLQELDLYDRRTAQLSHRLYLEVLRARMRPFGDGARRFQRMVRDLSRALGKEARLEILGEATQVDRDLLEQLETPLAHLLRNAVDHGCETPAERERVGKPREGLIRLEARHSGGMLLVTVADDGPGIDHEKLQQTVIDRRLASPEAVAQFTEPELLDYLFLPGITLKDAVTDISGRGVGLDVVQNVVRSVRGAVRVSTLPGRGSRFQLQLPLTLSVLRALLVEVGKEPYAIPLARISRTLKLPRPRIQKVERRQFFFLGNQQVGLASAGQLLECGGTEPAAEELPVVVLSDRNQRHGLVVDRFLGERELVVQPLDPRLGKVRDISAAALMEDGSPVLILDVEDILNSLNSGLAL